MWTLKGSGRIRGEGDLRGKFGQNILYSCMKI
jgi:hypothetical protein